MGQLAEAMGFSFYKTNFSFSWFVFLSFFLPPSLFPFLPSFLFCFSGFWPPHGIWSSQARDQIQATVLTYITAAAALDPFTYCARPGIEPLSRCCRDTTRSRCATAGTPDLDCFKMLVLGVPAVAQWVKNLTAAAWVTVEVWVRSLVPCLS